MTGEEEGEHLNPHLVVADELTVVPGGEEQGEQVGISGGPAGPAGRGLGIPPPREP